MRQVILSSSSDENEGEILTERNISKSLNDIKKENKDTQKEPVVNIDEDNDDDSVNPSKRQKKSVNTNEKHKQKTEVKQNGSKKSEKTTQKPPPKPFYPYIRKTTRAKWSVSKLCNALKDLNEPQKIALKKMGFGHIMSMDIKKVPTILGHWLISNYDHERDELNIGSRIIEVTSKEVREIFGIPNGSKKIEETNRPRSGSSAALDEFRSQFAAKKKVQMTDAINALKQCTDGVRLFSLNFLVIFNTIIGETTKATTVNQKFLKSIGEDVDIANLDWCSYMITLLKRTKRNWKTTAAYNGPLSFLAVLYTHERNKEKDPKIVKQPAITYINTGTLKTVETCLKCNEGEDDEEVEQDDEGTEVDDNDESEKDDERDERAVVEESDGKIGEEKEHKCVIQNRDRIPWGDGKEGYSHGECWQPNNHVGIATQEMINACDTPSPFSEVWTYKGVKGTQNVLYSHDQLLRHTPAKAKVPAIEHVKTESLQELESNRDKFKSFEFPGDSIHRNTHVEAGETSKRHVYVTGKHHVEGGDISKRSVDEAEARVIARSHLEAGLNGKIPGGIKQTQQNEQLFNDSGGVQPLDPKQGQCELDDNASPVSASQGKEKDPSCQSGVVCIQGYMVKGSIAPILETIFKKHGDIAAKCVFKSDSARASFLEIVCEVVRRTQTHHNIMEEMEEIECEVSDAEASNIDVSWLQAHLEALKESKEASRKCSLLMETKAKTVLVKRAAEMDLIARSVKLMAAQKQFRNAERCVSVLHLVEKNLNDNILESKAKVNSWVNHPIV